MTAICSHSETDYRARSWKDRLSSWSTYAAAAGAALATASSAEANIIVGSSITFVNPATPISVKLGNPPSYTGNQSATQRFTIAGKTVEIAVGNATHTVG